MREKQGRGGGTEKRTRGGRRNAQGGKEKHTRKGGTEKRTRKGRTDTQFSGQTHRGSYRGGAHVHLKT